ncbi:MAG: dihydrodipicolinate synthase family protein [Steroidobacteraceae bacterium]
MTILDENSRGVFMVAATPFTEDGHIDLHSTDRMIDFYLSAGVTGLTLLGMMGEANKLTAAESATFVSHVARRVAGRVPLVVGVSTPNFAALGELARQAMDAGCAGVMVAPPTTVRTDDQIVQYFQNVARFLNGIPFVLQDFPLSTCVQMSMNVLKRIIADIPSCVMLKHEDWPGLSKISQLRQASEQGLLRRISILVGNGGLFLAEELERGADGAMTGFAFPEMMVEICAAHERGDRTRARDLFDAYLPLMRYEQQPGIGLAIRKYVLAKRGVLASPALREPRTLLSAADVAEVDLLVERQLRKLREIGAWT